MGVWIETIRIGVQQLESQVTPFVGVWIETSVASQNWYRTQSHPSWVCGLKQKLHILSVIIMEVTPFVGVWIETLIYKVHAHATLSHPSWVCGLKLPRLHRTY